MHTPSGDRLRLSDLAARPTLKRSIPTSKLSRLADVSGLIEPAQLEMILTTDASGRHWLQGTVTVALATDCQRCLEPVTSRLEASFNLWLVEEQAEERLKANDLEVLQGHDVRLIADGMIDVVQLVEDELLLALPEQPCKDDACPRMPRLSFPGRATDAKAGTESGTSSNGENDRESASDGIQQDPAAASASTTQTRRPFADLRKMMTESGNASAKQPSSGKADE